MREGWLLVAFWSAFLSFDVISRGFLGWVIYLFLCGFLGFEVGLNGFFHFNLWLKEVLTDCLVKFLS